MGYSLVELAVLVAYPAFVCFAYTFASLQAHLAKDFALVEFVAAFAVVAFAAVVATFVPCAVAGLN